MSTKKQQMLAHHYLLELQTRFNLVRLELKCADAEIGAIRKDPAHALIFVERMIAEAQKLKLHLEAWDNYVKPPSAELTR